MSTPVPVRLLILEDNPVDVELLLHDLRRAGFELEYELVASEGDYSAKLNESFELILADYSLPHFDAPAALRLLQQRHLDIPFIIVSGTVGEEQAVALIKQGATDYLLKDRLGRLGIAVTQALEAKRLRDEQQQSQVALRASEERFRALVQHSTDVITILAADMTVLYESPSLEKVMGYRPEAVQGLNITDVIHPDDLPLIVERMSTILEQPATTFSVEVRLRHADGSWRLQEAAVTNLLDHPAIHGIVVNSRDITERKQTEAQLATQAKLLDQLSDSIIKLDIHGIIEFWNRGSERLYGWSAEEVTGKLLADVIQTQVVNDTMENAVRRVLDTGGWNGEYVQTRKDGTSLPVLNATTLLRDGHGNPVGYVGINRDITERKRATEAILESEARFRAVFEHSPLGKSLTAPNGKLLQVNQAFAALLGYSIDEMQQIDFTQITYPQDVAESRECVRRLLANEQRQYRMEKRYVHKNGRLIWTDVNTALLRDATGSPLYFMTSVADITEHKRAEQALHQYNRRIEILHSIDRGILTAQSPQKIAEMIAQSLTELIHYDAIRIIGISSSENPLP
ncbi:MAG: PAS domain S-box protein, partial [Chloroflexota bacterium]